MAVTVDATAFDAAFPSATSDERNRLRTLVTRLIDDYAPGAPDEVATEAAIRCGAYINTTPGVLGGIERIRSGTSVETRFRVIGSPLRRSGAMALLSPYRVRRAV